MAQLISNPDRILRWETHVLLGVGGKTSGLMRDRALIKPAPPSSIHPT